MLSCFYDTRRNVNATRCEELDQQAFSIKGATMPNGKKYEDWLKAKAARGESLNDDQNRLLKEYEDHLKSKGRGEDGENSGSS
jgi:hypothetical protein